VVNPSERLSNRAVATELAGILNVYKPSGPTSHDIVALIRRWSGVRRVGHAGTLDPLAEGVLLVCLGRATRVVEFLMGSTKQYRAEITFGISTDTYDAAGTVVSQSPPERIPSSRKTIEEAIRQFVGEIEQIPPAFSALKKDGQPLYKRARRGENVAAQARRVRIDEIVIVGWQTPKLVIEVTCGAGTYIRSLAHDLGTVLGCGAYLTALTRLASGQFTAEDAAPLDAVREAFENGTVTELLHPLDTALAALPRLTLSADDARRLLRGQPVIGAGSPDEAGTAATPWRAYDAGGQFLALVVYDRDHRRWRPKKVFADPR